MAIEGKHWNQTTSFGVENLKECPFKIAEGAKASLAGVGSFSLLSLPPPPLPPTMLLSSLRQAC
jgi:hypothetical protein